MVDYQITQHFNSSEFRCPCCGKLILDEELVKLLERFRKVIGCPVYIKSGYRCFEHNVAVGGAKHSYHLLGRAADIRVVNIDRAKHYARQYFHGVGFYDNHIHVDNRSGYAFWDKQVRK